MRRFWILGLAALLTLAGSGPFAGADDKAPDAKKIDELLKDLKGKDAAKKKHAAVALGAVGAHAPEKVVKGLADALKDTDDKVRWAAALSLGSLGQGAKG